MNNPTVEERKSKIEACVTKLNDAIVKGDKEYDIEKAIESIKEDMAQLNIELRHIEYNKFINAEEATILAALYQGEVPQYKFVVKRLDKESTTRIYDVVLYDRLIDIVELGKYVKAENIFNSAQWIYQIEAFTDTWTARLVADLKAKKGDDGFFIY